MKIFDYCSLSVVEISDAQYDFMQCVIKHSGRMEEVRKEYAITDEQFENWKKDPVFWPVLNGHLTILYESKGLTPEYVKSYLLATLTGKNKPTKEQMQAINHSIKAIGIGLAPRTGFNGSITVSPEHTKIVFDDGLDKK